MNKHGSPPFCLSVYLDISDLLRTLLPGTFPYSKERDKRIIVEIRRNENIIQSNPTKIKPSAKRVKRHGNKPRGKRNRGVKGRGNRPDPRGVKSKSRDGDFPSTCKIQDVRASR